MDYFHVYKCPNCNIHFGMDNKTAPNTCPNCKGDAGNLAYLGTARTQFLQENNGPTLEDEFQTLWMMYPRRLGKLNAYKAYVKARRKGATYEQIETGIKNYVHHINENKMDLNYVKHASTWFNNQGWEDDYSQ